MSTLAQRRLSRRRWLGAAALAGPAVSFAPLGLGACTRDRERGDGSRTLRLWAHQGQEPEHRALRGAAAAFEAASQGALRVEMTSFPDHHYTERVSIAAAAGDLPDAFEIDGPLVARFVEAGLIQSIDGMLPDADLQDFLPTVREQGTIEGHLYTLGAFESASVLYYDRELFARAGVRVPPEQAAFEWPELLDACERLRAIGVEPLALHMNDNADEWFTYAFTPVIWSAGGRLIDERGHRVRGELASPRNVASLEAWQALFRRGYANPTPVEPDPFGRGAVAMDWSGHWMARAHLGAKGDNLGVMRLPRLGPHPASPCGTWCWGISRTTQAVEPARRWLEWITGTTTGVQPLVTASGAVPSRRSAFAAFPEYQRLPYSLFRRQLEQGARPRPRTSFYATLTREFAAALRDIARGFPVGPRLARAEDAVQQVIDRRLGAPPRGDG